MTKYKRVLIKLSGEILLGKKQSGIDFDYCAALVGSIKVLLKENIQVAIVIGGGNIIRGADVKEIPQVASDKMGMLSTMINAIALEQVFIDNEVNIDLFSSIEMNGFLPSPFNWGLYRYSTQ